MTYLIVNGVIKSIVVSESLLNYTRPARDKCVPVKLIPLRESSTAVSVTCDEHFTVNRRCPEESANCSTRELFPIPYIYPIRGTINDGCILKLVQEQ